MEYSYFDNCPFEKICFLSIWEFVIKDDDNGVIEIYYEASHNDTKLFFE